MYRKIHLNFLTKVQKVKVIKIMKMAVSNFVYSVKKIYDRSLIIYLLLI